MSRIDIIAKGTRTRSAKVYTIEVVIRISWVMFGEIGTEGFVLETRP